MIDNKLLSLTSYFLAVFELNGQTTRIPFKKYDESGNSSIKIDRFCEGPLHKYVISKHGVTLSYSTTKSFEFAFVSGSNSDNFVWLVDSATCSKHTVAFISIPEKLCYEINLKNILDQHHLITSTVVRSNGDQFEFWNIGEWAYSDLGISVSCRLSPYSVPVGIFSFDYKNKRILYVDLGKDNGKEFIHNFTEIEKDLVVHKLDSPLNWVR
jgi:hypothetical protein